MSKSKRSAWKKLLHQATRGALAVLPRAMRFWLFRSMIDCDPNPDERLVLKIADSKEELEACFRILHDAYVSSGFMKPDPTGMRVTSYHALPTTTTLCAKFDGEVVGTLSIVREGVFGFPLQSIFDLSSVRKKQGNIAEISALAIHPKFRKTGGAILFPLMKFMYEYCTKYFDTRHLVIAVNPNKIELYESLLFFERLQAHVVDNYDFANGAPAVGATLDLYFAPEIFRAAYAHKSDRKNLYKYFVEIDFMKRNIIQQPVRKYHTTNDPVMSVEILDYFFNRVNAGFEKLDARKKRLLKSIYDIPEYRKVLPDIPDEVDDGHPLRRHQRYSIKCPGSLAIEGGAVPAARNLSVIEVSLMGFQAESSEDWRDGFTGIAVIELGANERSYVKAKVVRKRVVDGANFYGFQIETPDEAWRYCVEALEKGQIHSDLGGLDEIASAPRTFGARA
jgi:GNAT superfamily N-acetyltransferase